MKGHPPFNKIIIHNQVGKEIVGSDYYDTVVNFA